MFSMQCQGQMVGFEMLKHGGHDLAEAGTGERNVLEEETESCRGVSKENSLTIPEGWGILNSS